MATVTFDRTGPGAAATSQVFGNGVRKIVTGQFSFDSSYPTGGEDISDITGRFSECKGIIFTDPSGSAGTGKKVVVDLDEEKALLYTNAATPAEVADASDQSGAADLRFIAWGT